MYPDRSNRPAHGTDFGTHHGSGEPRGYLRYRRDAEFRPAAAPPIESAPGVTPANLASALPRARFLLLALGASVAMAMATATAQAQTVTGQVVDAVNGRGVDQALVVAVAAADPTAAAEEVELSALEEARPLSATTDSVGHFTLSVGPGSYSFVVEHIGYQTLRSPAVDVGSDELVTLELRLGPLPFEMEPLVVRERRQAATWRGHFQRRMDQHRGAGRFITRADIERRSAGTVNSLLSTQPGLRLASVRGGQVIMMRSMGRNCLPMLYFDGMPVSQTVAAVDLNHWFHPDAIEGIEIYRSAAMVPVDLHGDGCGVIAIWSRRDEVGRPFSWTRMAIGVGMLSAILLKAFR